jgi:two-component system nitrate/nitrite response regulator NarL
MLDTAKTVAVCDTEPIAMEGLRSLLQGCEDLRIVAAEESLLAGMDVVRQYVPCIAVMDKAFGIHAVMDWIRRLRNSGTRPVVWGAAITEAEAIRLVQAGAMGVVRKNAGLLSLLACLRAVASGTTWMDECVYRESERGLRGHRSNLTSRELQVVELIERGMRNKDIGNALGIQAGTVKIHLKHIFEKTGIRGRYGLALSGLREKGLLSLPTM